MQSLKVNVGPIHLVLSQNVLLKLYEKKFRYSHLPEAIQIQADFQVLNSQEGVPAAIKQHEGKDVLLLYTSTYFLGAYPSNRNDGYRIAYIDPLNLGEHERLAKGVLMLRGPGWYIHGTLPEIPRGSSNYWGPIRNTWHYLENQSRQAKIDSSTGLEMLTPAHENFLNTIGTLVEVTRKLEQDKNKLPMMIPYGKVESAGEERYAPRDVYIFNLSGSPEVNEKNLLRIKEAPYLRGRVFALKGNKLTVKFEGMIDSALIPPRGTLSLL